MPELARVLPFRGRTASSHLSAEQASFEARRLLSASESEREIELNSGALANVDVLLSFCTLLRERVNTAPGEVAGEASALYQWLLESEVIGYFDERDYFLGESALLAANAHRLVGKRDAAERWLDRADASFRHTLNPAPNLARVSYDRLALRYEMRRYDEVLELIPSVTLSFDKLAMAHELAKCRYLEAAALKDVGKISQAALKLEALTADAAQRANDPGLIGMAFVALGDIHACEGLLDRAMESYRQALGLLTNAKRTYALAYLKTNVAECLRRQGDRSASISAYREAIEDYASLQMSTWVAYVRILLAETLLELGRSREAEWEILAALPTIEEEKMVTEGFAAVGLLQESVRQRKTDPKALSELREYLQAKN